MTERFHFQIERPLLGDRLNPKLIEKLRRRVTLGCSDWVWFFFNHPRDNPIIRTYDFFTHWGTSEAMREFR